MENQTVRTKRFVVEAAILCGGQGSRLNYQNKGLLKLNNTPLVMHQIKQLQGLTESIIINNNDQAESYKSFGLKSIPDEMPGNLGPLSGIYTSLHHCQKPTTHLIVLAVDYPFVKQPLLQQLINTAKNYPNHIIASYDGCRSHPLISIYPVYLKPAIKHFLSLGERRVFSFIQQHKLRYIDASKYNSVTFSNINQPEHMAIHQITK